METSSCALVAKSAWARAVPGVPNTVWGLGWCGALAWLAIGWLRAGVVVVPWWAHTGAAATVCQALEIDHTKEIYTPDGRPIRVVDKGEKVVKELF